MDFIGYGKRFKVSKNSHSGWWTIVEHCDHPVTVLRPGKTALEAFEKFIADYEKEFIKLQPYLNLK